MIAWFLGVIGVWLMISVASHIITDGGYSPLPGAKHQKVFLKWSTIFSVCFCIPILGWIGIGYVLLNKSKFLNK